MQHDMATTNNSYLLRINSAERTPIDPWLPRIQNNDEYLELGLTFAPPNSASCSSNTSNEQFEPIGDVGALRLADALQYNDHLQYLNLSRNGIGGIGGAALAKALYQYIKGASDQYVSRTALRSLNLSKNQIGDEGAEAFTQMLEYNTSLTRFDLSFNGISFKNVNQLLESLEKNSTVTAIYLTGNLKNVNARDMSHLVDRLCSVIISCNQLEVLNLGSEQVNDEQSNSMYDVSLGSASDQDVSGLLQTMYGVPHDKKSTDIFCNFSNEYKIQNHRLRELTLPSGKGQSTDNKLNTTKIQLLRVFSFNAFYHPILQLHDFLSSTTHKPKYFDSKLPNHLQRDIHSGALVGLLPTLSFNNISNGRSTGIRFKEMPRVIAFTARECSLDTLWNVLRYRPDVFRYARKSFREKGRVALGCEACQIL
jgi:hypothetical protein